MTEQRTEYRDVLEQLAKSHGLFGAEDLAEQAHEADPTYGARDILENPQAGFGEALNLVLDMSEEERERVSKAFARTFLSGRTRPAVCTVPGCDRPREGASFPGCAEHRRLYDARAKEEARDLVVGIVGPWLESTEKIGSEELTRVMQGAFEEAERGYNSALDELEAAEAAL